jgi:hypothetical protein
MALVHYWSWLLLHLQAAAATPSLSPQFMRHRAKFPDASLHYDINVKLYDNRDKDWHLLGEASLPASAIPGTDPVFLWLPLQPPKHEGLPIIKVRFFYPVRQ